MLRRSCGLIPVARTEVLFHITHGTAVRRASSRRPPIFFPTLTYAEIHYRPWFIPSLLFRREPEILFDAPSRVEPGRPIPLLLLIKDADRFPTALEAVIVRLVYENGTVRTLRFPYGGIEADEPVWWDSYNIIPEHRGRVRIHPFAVVRRGRKRVVVAVDNYPGTSRLPLTVIVSPHVLPTAKGWFHGDIHCHTSFTADQIEFGAPLEAASLAAACTGLDWIAATDHSYDLDDREDDYLAADPALTKWSLMRKKAELINMSIDGFTVIPGEEATCRNRRGRNCHLLTLGAERFIHGSGDSGERGLHSDTEHSLAEAAAVVTEWNGLSCAAHPFEKVSWPERLVLNRGEWERHDLETPGIDALQIHNGVRDRGFRRGMRNWIRLLLSGRRVFAFGGNDSHGDMNRRRGISIPFVSIDESPEHLLGMTRTVVYAPSRSLDNILDALRNGRAQVTEGPFIDLVINAGNTLSRPGDTIEPGCFPVRAEFLSSPEFGHLRQCRLLAGSAGAKEEQPLPVFEKTGEVIHRHVFESMLNLEGRSYLRAECETESGKICFTNPVWIGSGAE